MCKLLCCRLSTQADDNKFKDSDVNVLGFGPVAQIHRAVCKSALFLVTSLSRITPTIEAGDVSNDMLRS